MDRDLAGGGVTAGGMGYRPVSTDNSNGDVHFLHVVNIVTVAHISGGPTERLIKGDTSVEELC
ncbi:hypothetical protein NQZ68_008369 [Dissostichus eleginoides]|nr:hypothetical protein NQZ68_008369 [Dissostichus eleginoides]